MKQRKLTGRDIDVMTPRQKQRLVESYERQTPEERWAASCPLTPAEKERARRMAARMRPGRPKLGKGTRVVSVTVEIDLLKRADAYAKQKGLKRAELFTQGLRRVVPGAPK
ncbi:MAG TPA: hypothetical protein VG269_28005 [Tepidisphaeraceae bacterium]|jgi:hypothetical protein|nr:hypothetical protein [Tepidisphaeraceae bacterium]